MSGKGKRRREARRRARRHGEEQPQVRPPAEGEVEAGAAEPQPEPEHPAAASEAGHGRAARKRAKRRGGPWERLRRLRVSPWLIAVPVLAIGVGVVAVLVLTGGSSGTTGAGSPASSPTPDPRVAGLSIDASFSIEAGDDEISPASSSFFQPSVITASAGGVIEIVVTNTGSVSHNLWVAGPDNEYDTADDFGPPPLIIPGETGRIVVKIDEPGTYLFRCQIHPLVQTGTLVLQ